MQSYLLAEQEVERNYLFLTKDRISRKNIQTDISDASVRFVFLGGMGAVNNYIEEMCQRTTVVRLFDQRKHIAVAQSGLNALAWHYVMLRANNTTGCVKADTITTFE